MGGAPAGLGQVQRRGDLRRGLGLHVLGAAAPDLAVDQIARPRVALPLGRVGQDGVDVRQQPEHRTVGGAAQARHEVRALRRAAAQLDLEAGVAKQDGQLLLQRPLVARRVDRAVADELAQQLDGALLKGHGARQ